MGIKITADKGIALKSGFTDESLVQAGAQVSELGEGTALADIIIRIAKPTQEDLDALEPGTLHISFLDPFNEKDLIQKLADKKISAISMEMIPRSTLAQKMDALSSQANLAGYFSVVKAAEILGKVLPMMMTPSGTIAPAKVFVIGVGVAGLQAIATAKRMGAQVQAFDTRPEVEEQVKSIGGKFLKIDLGETGQTEQGYAKELTPEQIIKQKEGMKKACSQSDIVITTAKLFGRPAPTLVDADMIAVMKRGSVVVDLAVETGGNVEGSVLNKTVENENGVKIIGLANLEGQVAKDASSMLAANFANLIEHFWDKDQGLVKLNPEDEVLRECLITHGGAVVHERFKEKTSK
jgi:NAD(P) transhydrogenase subunit alpha